MSSSIAVKTPSSAPSRTVVVVAAAAVAAVAAYAVYFDRTRRSNAEFRRSLRTNRRRAAAALAAANAEHNAARKTPHDDGAFGPLGDFTPADLEEPRPADPEQLGRWVLKQLQMGEMLLAQGPQALEPAIACFLRALLNFPNPTQLLSMLSSSIPQPVFEVLVQMYTETIKKRADDELHVE